MSSRFSRLFKQANAHASLLRDTSFYLFGFATWLPAFIFFNSHVAELSWINGASMYPYLNTDYNKNLKRDLCLNWKWKPLDGLRRGMIVTFWSPTDPDKQVVKRIIALEGDRVYTRAPYPVPIVDVPPGHVWVEGDGGRQSIDSNTYGPITKSLIIGKITHVLLPWSSSGQIHWEHFRGKTRIIRGPLP